MVSKVEICNMGLSHVGGYRIQSLSETSKEAKECNTFYEIAINGVLEDHDWTFARKRLTLALLSDTYTGWEYTYQYPTDCIAPRYLIDSTGAYTGTSYDIDDDKYIPVGRVKYEIISDSTLSNRLILTDMAEAELVYTAKVTDTNMFSYKFIEALALKLASYLAQPLKGDAQLRQNLIGLYQLMLYKAKGVDSNTENSKEDDVNTFVDARN